MVLSASTPTLTTNRLLAALSATGRNRFVAGCERIELGLGEVLVEAGAKTRYVYFPIGGFISLVAARDADARLEVGLVGDEGMLGAELILGVNVAPLQALVQGAGMTLRLSATDFRHELENNPALRLRLNRYVYVLIKQIAQTAICNRYHFVEARLARWLLMTRDRAHDDRFHVTQEFMAYMLGVRRVGVSKAAGMLEALGTIQYSRGQIHIVDSVGLENAACKCYQLGKDMYENTLAPARGSAQRRI